MSIKPRAGRIKSLSALINKDTSILGQVFNKAAHLKQIETLLHSFLPEELRNLYRVGSYESKKLLLLTSSASNLTRLRFFEAQLLYKLQQELPDLIKLEVKVRPAPPETKKVLKKLIISTASQDKLKSLAEEVDDPRLKAVLVRLGNKSQN